MFTSLNHVEISLLGIIQGNLPSSLPLCPWNIQRTTLRSKKKKKPNTDRRVETNINLENREGDT